MPFIITTFFIMAIVFIVLAVSMVYEAAICLCAPGFPLSFWEAVMTYLAVVVVALVIVWRNVE